MYSPLRKALEAAISYIENDLMWGSISVNQAGARPNTMMWTQTAEVLRLMDQYEVAWFVDYTEAFNRIHQPLLVDELRRRYAAVRQAL